MTSERERAADLEGEVATQVSVAAEPSGAAAPSGRPHAPWREVLLLGALTAFGSVAMDMYLPALPTLTRALNASPAAGQATISVFLAGLGVGQLAYGPLSDRWGRRGPALAGIGLYALACAACLVAQDMRVMTAARLLQAVGACGGGVIARAVVRDRYEDHEVIHVYAMLSLVSGVAPALAPLIGGFLLAAAGWRSIFAVQLGFALAVGAWTYLALPESRSAATRDKARESSAAASYLALLRKPLLVGYLLTGAFSGAALFAYINSAPEVLITIFHIPPSRFGWVFGVNAIGLIGANQINARLSRRLPARALIRGSLGSALVAGGALLVCAETGWGGLWGVLVPLFLVLASLGFTQPNATAGAMGVDRERAGAAAALLGVGFFGVGGLAGVATAVLHDGTARPMALVILASLATALTVFEATAARVRPAQIP